jgi:hypothetical protein
VVGGSPEEKLYIAFANDMRIERSGIDNKYWQNQNATQDLDPFYMVGRCHHVWRESTLLIVNKQKRDS